MNEPVQKTSGDYGIKVFLLDGTVRAFHGEKLIASSANAKVMYETRLPPTIYFPKDDLLADISSSSPLRTFCPFKGTASYNHVGIDGGEIENGAWVYNKALPEAKPVEGHIAFLASAATRYDLGVNSLGSDHMSHISGPTVNWLLREAWLCKTPVDLTRTIAEKLVADGIAISRISVMIWSLHPLIVGKNYVWSRDTGEVEEFTPNYDIHHHPAFVNSPLKHVSDGLGGVRQRLDADELEFDFPILDDLKAEGATDYVAMPLQFSKGQINVMTLTSDHPSGFTTANLGLIFELSTVLSRYYEVFTLQGNSQALLETYLGKRTGARVLGGEIRRGDGDEIDAAILFCDLRGSTRLEEELGRVDYLDLLNRFFESANGVVNDHGGEVLKFIGDAVLAIFPAGESRDHACKQAQLAARNMATQIRKLSSDDGNTEIDCSIGVAFGNVTYGNVGSRERLDFTVIGSAANVAARLADAGKSKGQSIVVTKDLVFPDADATPLGELDLRNVSEVVEAFGLPPIES